MKNRRLIYKNNDIVIFLKGKKNYLSVELNEDDLHFQKYFFKNYYKPTKNFLLKFVMVEDNKLLFEFPSDFNFIDYSFITKYDFLTDICKFKRLLLKNVDLEYNLNNFIIKELLELKQDNLIEKNQLKEIMTKFSFLKIKSPKKYYINVISDLIFKKLLIHRKENKFYFLDYATFSISNTLQIEDNKKINYCEL